MMDQFKYCILPPAMHGGNYREFLFEIFSFKEGIYGYAGQCVQHTRWMKEITDLDTNSHYKLLRLTNN